MVRRARGDGEVREYGSGSGDAPRTVRRSRTAWWAASTRSAAARARGYDEESPAYATAHAAVARRTSASVARLGTRAHAQGEVPARAGLVGEVAALVGEAPGGAAMGAYACARARGHGDDISARRSPTVVAHEARARGVLVGAARSAPPARAASRTTSTPPSRPNLGRFERASTPRLLGHVRDATSNRRPPPSQDARGSGECPPQNSSRTWFDKNFRASTSPSGVHPRRRRRPAHRVRSSRCASLHVDLRVYGGGKKSRRRRSPGLSFPLVPSRCLERRLPILASSRLSPLASFTFAPRPTPLTAHRPAGGGGRRGTWTR